MKEKVTGFPEKSNNLIDIKANIEKIPFRPGGYLSETMRGLNTWDVSDLMRLLPGFGCEYGIDWVVKEVLSEIESVDTEELFEESIRSCYSEETKIGWLSVDTVSAIKELDPVSWDMAKSEWLDAEESDENLMKFDSGATHCDP